MPDILDVQKFDPGTELRFSVQNEQETEEVAKNFIACLEPGDVVALYGELGAGKTALVRMMAASLGYTGFVNSPTFTILNIYNAEKHALYHFDFYRIDHEEEATDIGFDEYVQSGGICFIEWPERVQNLLPAERYEIHLDVPDYANRPTARTLLIRRT